jgi:predicted nucleic acid-binding protein
MTIFVDTSALLAVLDADDQQHAFARQAWEELVTREEDLVCTTTFWSTVRVLMLCALGISTAFTSIGI